MSIKIQAIREDVKGLRETTKGQLSAGFVMLAPEQMTAYFGGREKINALADCSTNTNCKGGNCVAGCGGSAQTIQ